MPIKTRRKFRRNARKKNNKSFVSGHETIYSSVSLKAGQSSTTTAKSLGLSLNGDYRVTGVSFEVSASGPAIFVVEFLYPILPPATTASSITAFAGVIGTTVRRGIARAPNSSDLWHSYFDVPIVRFSSSNSNTSHDLISLNRFFIQFRPTLGAVGRTIQVLPVDSSVSISEVTGSFDSLSI